MELSICRSEIAGLRIAAARLLVSDRPAVRYEIAMPKGNKPEELGKPGVFTFFGVDAGLACFADAQSSQEYRDYSAKWKQENPDKNPYVDYFQALFRKSYEMYPQVRPRTGTSSSGRYLGASTGLYCFPAAWGMAYTADIGAWTRRGDRLSGDALYESGAVLNGGNGR